jgi:hypothetical protein
MMKIGLEGSGLGGGLYESIVSSNAITWSNDNGNISRKGKGGELENEKEKTEAVFSTRD